MFLLPSNSLSEPNHKFKVVEQFQPFGILS